MGHVAHDIENIVMGKTKGERGESRELQLLTGEEWLEAFEEHVSEKRRAVLRGLVRQGKMDVQSLDSLGERAFVHYCFANSKKRGLLSSAAQKMKLPLLPKSLKVGDLPKKRKRIWLLDEQEEEKEDVDMVEAEAEEEEEEEKEEDADSDGGESTSSFLSSFDGKKPMKRRKRIVIDEEEEEEEGGETFIDDLKDEKVDGKKKRKKKHAAYNSSGSLGDVKEMDSCPTVSAEELDGEKDEEEEARSKANEKWNGKKGTLDKDTTYDDLMLMGEDVKNEVVDHVLCHGEKHPELYLSMVKSLLEKKELNMHMLRQKSKLCAELPDDVDEEDHEDLTYHEGESEADPDVEDSELPIKGARTYSLKNKQLIVDQTNKVKYGRTFHQLRFRRAQPYRTRDGKWMPYWQTK